MHYFTLVFADDSGFGFAAPDVDGFTAYVETDDFSFAEAEARRVLAAHLIALLDAGGAIPPARSLARLKEDPEIAQEIAEADVTVMLPAILPAGRTLRVNLSFDENTLQLIDAGAQARGLTRSAFLAETARSYIAAESISSLVGSRSYDSMAEVFPMTSPHATSNQVKAVAPGFAVTSDVDGFSWSNTSLRLVDACHHMTMYTGTNQFRYLGLIDDLGRKLGLSSENSEHSFSSPQYEGWPAWEE